jgi:hypothetical protein
MAKRFYLGIGLVALIAIAFSAVTLTSSLTSAGGTNTPQAAQGCDQQGEADDASEGADQGEDTDTLEVGCGDQNESEDAGADVTVPCSDPAGADDDSTEAQGAPDTDNIEEQCGAQDESD